jgi:hypothetical protein
VFLLRAFRLLTLLSCLLVHPADGPIQRVAAVDAGVRHHGLVVVAAADGMSISLQTHHARCVTDKVLLQSPPIIDASGENMGNDFHSCIIT